MKLKTLKIGCFALVTLLISGCANLLPTLPSRKGSSSKSQESVLNSSSNSKSSKSTISQDNGGFKYLYIGNNHYAIGVGDNIEAEEIDIPSSYNDMYITEIMDNGFENCAARRISIPETITNIGNFAFAYCYNLESIVIPSSVMHIGNNAFQDCNNMIYAQFLSSYPPTIGSDLFCITWNREEFSIIVPDGYLDVYLNIQAEYWENAVPHIVEENNRPLMDENGFKYTAYENGYAVSAGTNRYISGEIVIPSTFNGKPVLSIAQRGFGECSASSIILPSTLINIQDHAFEICNYLFSITIPQSVTSIGSFAFAHSERLRTIMIEGDVPPTVANDTFNDLYNNRSIFIVVPSYKVDTYQATFKSLSSNIKIIGKDEYEKTKDNDILYRKINNNEYEAYANTDYYPSLVIPATVDGYKVTAIAANGFENCTINSITFSTNLKTIGDRAFQQVAGLASVGIPSNVTSLGEQAFYCCFELKTVRFNTVTPPSIGGDLFGGTWDVEDFTILVPNAGLSAYKSITSPYWQDYAVRRIKGY